MMLGTRLWIMFRVKHKDVYNHLELELEEIDDLYLLSFPLQQQRGFPDYMMSEMDRETVEYIVKNLWNQEVVNRYKTSFFCESYAQYHNLQYNNKKNHIIAKRIIEQALEAISGML